MSVPFCKRRGLWAVAGVSRLKGNLGNQNYEVPAGYDIPLDGSVVIYCKRFHVLFSIASLSPAA